MRMRTQRGRGSYLPVLMKVMGETAGMVVEFGAGYISTPYLHWACFPRKRPLVTFESHPEWYEFAKKHETEYHRVELVNDWDKVEIPENISVVLVDHAPDSRRINEVSRLVHAEYVVVHDTENAVERKYRFSRVFPLYKYRWKYRDTLPHTTVFSNQHDLSEFNV